jgi:hypothetical protein
MEAVKRGELQACKTIPLNLDLQPKNRQYVMLMEQSSLATRKRLLALARRPWWWRRLGCGTKKAAAKEVQKLNAASKPMKDKRQGD